MSTPKPYPIEEDFPIISNVNEIDYSATYSYANYMRFAFAERVEIIKGHIFQMVLQIGIIRKHLEVFFIDFMIF